MTNIQTEADALRAILSWSKDRPVWQRDALRRLLQNGELTDADMAALTEICKVPAKPSEPLTEEHISAQKAGAPTVALKNIRNVQNVNALADKQTLTFIPKGVTIIYGDNGAGKSGYVRMLKRSCRARNAKGKEEPLHPNIYEQSIGPQCAELEYHAGAQTQKATWKSGQSADALLSEISVFDSRTANVHVEETNDLAYTPFPMKVLERLVVACKAVKETIDGEIGVIKAQTPGSVTNPLCSPNTSVREMMASLGKNTKPTEVETLATLSDEEVKRLAELAADFAHDPDATARRLRAQKTRLETIRQKLQILQSAASEERAKHLASLSSSLSAKTEAAGIASAALFKDEPLDGVGSETWRTLWQAAREYSTAEAYPDKVFPVTGTEGRCVLCEQELGEEAGKDDVAAEIGRAKEIDALNTALKDTKPNTITAKNTELSRALVSERLRGRFAQEINHLNLGGLAIELEQAGSQSGISRFRVSLIHKKSENAGSILSEGEYRCIALAGFLAELATNDSESGIIFDDPVSSLDHLHREAIAKRLAAEGRKRQVIVFTHDLPFLFLLRNACVQVDDPALKTAVAVRHIQKRHDTPGYCRNEPPEKAQDARARLVTIRNHLAKAKAQYENDPDGTDWLITARGLIDSLRQTWEAAVEDAIKPVLRTFASKVNTKGFAKLSAITELHAKTMRNHYGECSVLLHKISDAMNPVAPTPERVETEVSALEGWLNDVEGRQKKIQTS